MSSGDSSPNCSFVWLRPTSRALSGLTKLAILQLCSDVPCILVIDADSRPMRLQHSSHSPVEHMHCRSTLPKLSYRPSPACSTTLKRGPMRQRPIPSVIPSCCRRVVAGTTGDGHTSTLAPCCLVRTSRVVDTDLATVLTLWMCTAWQERRHGCWRQPASHTHTVMGAASVPTSLHQICRQYLVISGTCRSFAYVDVESCVQGEHYAKRSYVHPKPLRKMARIRFQTKE
jgi:hypothetical protein